MPPRYVFLGDDFTGSTDVLEQLASNGISSVLFLAPPTAEQFMRFGDVQAFGIAGDSRSRSPEWMDTHLPAIYKELHAFGAPIVHYKVCSTFDSSSRHGSIGRAIELALPIFTPRFVPVVVGAPHLQRFVTEAELFALGPDGAVHRIDRHPMSRHPVTPMRQPNLRLHLAEQTALRIGHVTHRLLRGESEARNALTAELSTGACIILFDTIDSTMLRLIGHLLWRVAQQQPLFSASSSGLTSALIAAWTADDLIAQPPAATPIDASTPLLVISGSCSAMTARQVHWALDHHFAGIAVDPARLLAGETCASYREALLEAALRHLRDGKDTVLYTALGSTTAVAAGDALGAALGHILRSLLERSSIRRVILCGGDTSSHAVQQLGLTALTWITTLQPGAPLCRAHSHDPGAPALELALKGGQVGTDDFFGVARGQ